MSILYDKPFKNYNEQIDKLEKQVNYIPDFRIKIK